MKRVQQPKEAPSQLEQVKPEIVPEPQQPAKVISKGGPHSTSLSLNCIMNPQIQPAKPNPIPSMAVTAHSMKHSVPRRHMHIKPATKANALNDQIDRFALRMADKIGISVSDFAHPSQMTQENIMLVGRIIAENDNKLTEQGVLLESSRAIGSGARIPLDLSACPSYSLFPGQLVCLEGSNPDGSIFRVTKQLGTDNLIPSLPVSSERLQYNQTTSLLVASGPFTFDSGESPDYALLDRLIILAIEKQPDVFILIGPFIDAKNQAVKEGNLAEFPETILNETITGKLHVFQEKCPNAQLVLVPSLQDLTHDHIFPQCALQIPISKAILVPNPGVLFINEFVVAISAADALLHLNNQELSKGQPVDRIARMANHLVEQSSFYPLSPSFEGVNIDYNCLDALEFPFKPNLLIIPSALKNFAKAMPSDDLVFLNPGQFCKKQSLGTCAFVSILPPRPTNAQSVTCLDFTNRCRVDVVQF